MNTLYDLMKHLKKNAEFVPAVTDESWADMIQRTTASGRVCEVNRDVYTHFLEVLPPRWMGRNNFAFGEGADALRLFWSEGTPIGRRYYCRQLTRAESDQFCKLAGVRRDSG